MGGNGAVRRLPWLVAAATFLIAALVAARSVYVFWTPCHGSMLTGSLIKLSLLTDEFSAACLRRMDTGSPFLFGSDVPALGSWSVADLLPGLIIAVVGWISLVLGLGWARRTKLVAAVPAMAMLALGLLADLRWAPAWGIAVVVMAELVAIPMLVAMWKWEPQLGRLQVLCLAVILNGVLAFGLVHGAADYVLLSMINESNWDTPPGAGVGTIAWLSAAAVCSAVAGATPGLLTRPRDRSRR